MNGENWVLVAGITAWLVVRLTTIGVRARQQYRREQAKRATS
jgi:hypothetical protein